MTHEKTLRIDVDDTRRGHNTGRRYTIEYIPETHTVITNCYVGSGWSMYAHHGRSFEDTINVETTETLLRECLEAHSEEFAEILEEWRETYFDGNNHRGVWGDRDRAERVFDRIIEAVEQLPGYCDAGDYFAPANNVYEDRLRTARAAGQSIADLAAEMIDEESAEALLEQSDVETYLERLAEEIAESEAEND